MSLKSSQQVWLTQQIEPNPVIEAYKRDIDRTLIRKNLQLSHEERLLQLMSLQKFARELRQARSSLKRS
jgi:hypothetical protein